jgi:hypothetical protein
MTSFIKSAKAVYDVESELDYVEIVHERFVRGKGYMTYTDYINTKPLADWVVLTSKTQSIPYEKFLDTMCEKTLEVRQKMAWQREFIKKFCEDTLLDLVQRTQDESRLEYFFSVVHNIEL